MGAGVPADAVHRPRSITRGVVHVEAAVRLEGRVRRDPEEPALALVRDRDADPHVVGFEGVGGSLPATAAEATSITVTTTISIMKRFAFIIPPCHYCTNFWRRLS